MSLPDLQQDERQAVAPGIVMLLAILTTVSSVYPAFLAGALGPELRSSIDISEGFFGFVIGGFFIGSALGSVLLGRLGEHYGARRTITLSLLTTAAMTGLIALTIRSGPVLVAALFLAGIANSGGQTAANKLLSQSIAPNKLGFAMAVKQSGMPGATLLGGLAVPAIALTVGWPWAYGAASMLAIVALAFVLRFAPEDGPDIQRARRDAREASAVGEVGSRPTPSSRSTLIIAACAAFFSAAAAGTLGSWLTSSATDAGWSSGAAGLLLSVGAISGIGSRLLLGWRADRSSRLPMMTAAQFLSLGAFGALALAPRIEWTHTIGAVVAFGAGWSWPALFNFAVVRTNIAAAAHATGITQTGVYLGVVTGPIVMGQLVERSGYRLGWSVAGSSMLMGALIMSRVAHRFAVPAGTPT